MRGFPGVRIRPQYQGQRCCPLQVVCFAVPSLISATENLGIARIGMANKRSLIFFFSTSIAMSNASLFACGSTHQGQERFVHVSRERQCALYVIGAVPASGSWQHSSN